MVLMNYFQGSSGDTDMETRLMDTVVGAGREGVRKGEERMGCMERVTWKLTLPHVK